MTEPSRTYSSAEEFQRGYREEFADFLETADGRAFVTEYAEDFSNFSGRQAYEFGPLQPGIADLKQPGTLFEEEQVMTVRMRTCAGPADFPAISDFLYSLYQPHNRDGNWFQPIWEYAYTHPYFDEQSVHRIGIWEEVGRMVGTVLYESRLGEAFFQVHPAYAHLKPEMLAYAERYLSGTTNEGRRRLKAYVNDFDAAFERVVRSRGYEQEPGSHRPMSQFVIPDPFPPISLPEGFRVKSLADENDL